MTELRARWIVVLWDVAAPTLLTAVAAHELLYDHAGPLTWALVLTLIWPLALRRSYPVTVLACCLAVEIALWAHGTFTVASLTLLVALYSVAALRSLRYSLPASAAVEVEVMLLSVKFAPTGSVNDAVVLLTGLAAAALLGGTTVRAQRRYLASIEDRAARLERERAQQAELAAAAERTRIAREMHDVVAHGLAVVIALAEGAALTAPDDPVAASVAMREVAGTGRTALAEMRTLLGVLRTDGAIDRAPQPTLHELASLAADVRRTGLAVDLTVAGDVGRLGDGVQTNLFRIVQEAMTNVLKHAAGARQVGIDVAVRPDCVYVDVRDDGRPSETLEAVLEGHGLSGMRERAVMLGGTLDAGPTPDGWRVRGTLPVG